MKQLSKKDLGAIRRSHFLARLPAYAFVGAVLGAITGIMAGSQFLFYTCLLLTPVVLSHMAAKKDVERQNQLYRHASESVISSLEQADYYNSDLYGAIAVDVKSKRISTVSADRKQNFSDPYVFDGDKVKKYWWNSPACYQEYTAKNGGIMDTSEAHARSVQSRHDFEMESGIFIDLDDISKPQVVVQMTATEAEKWILIFDKLFDGTLESQPSPMSYPPQ